MESGRVVSVSFSYDSFKELHIKNFKGAFFDKYGYPIPDEYVIDIIAEGDQEDPNLNGIGKMLFGYVAEGNNWNISGHEDIFKYKLKSFTPTDGENVFDTPELDNSLGVVGILIYHKSILAVVIAAKKDFLESLPNAKNKERTRFK